MRLLFLSNFFPPYDLGGMENRCKETVMKLQERGHDVHVLTSRFGVGAGTERTKDVTRSLYLQANINYYRSKDFFFKRIHQEKANLQELHRTIEYFSPDLILIWGMWNLSRNLPYWAEQWLPNQVVYFIASYWPIEEDVHFKYWKTPARRVLTEVIKYPFRAFALSQLHREGYPPPLKVKHAACPSQYMRDILVQAGKLSEDSRVLYSGIDPSPYVSNSLKNDRKQQEPLRLIYFGSLVPHKGVHNAVEAIGLLKQRGMGQRVNLTILGSGHPRYEARLKAMVTQLEVDTQVHFAGRVPREEIPVWLNKHDVFLFTSIWAEPMARSVMEAMAAGLTVIGSEVGGQVEMFSSGQNALTYQAEDVNCLADHIVRVLENPMLLTQLAQAGQQLVLEKFTLKRMIDDIENWLESIIN